MLRPILGTLAGIITGIIVIYLVEWMGHTIFPGPEGFDASDPASVKTMFAQLSFGSLLFVLFAWLVGTVAAGYVASRIAVVRPGLPTGILTAVFLLFGIMNFVAIPHPLWMVIVGVFCFLSGPFLGSRLALEPKVAS